GVRWCSGWVGGDSIFLLMLLVAMDSLSRLKHHRRHSCLLEHNKLVVSVDAHVRVDQLVPVPAHDGLCVLTGILQASVFQLLPKQAGEQQAFLEIGIPVRHENRVAAKLVAEKAFPALEFPTLEKLVRHGIMVDRNKQICG